MFPTISPSNIVYIMLWRRECDEVIQVREETSFRNIECHFLGQIGSSKLLNNIRQIVYITGEDVPH